MSYRDSYDRHNKWYNKLFPSEQAKKDLYKRKKQAVPNNLSEWLQHIFFSSLDPLLQNKSNKWLTIGDAYGFDAQYITKFNIEVIATDLNIDFLTIAVNEGIISSCAAENAESISFTDESFDYVLCKESYHHFPRPYSAVYEMLRVARKAVVIMEPQDPVMKMPLLLFLNNILTINQRLLSRIWKNRFSYEPVGNFVYKVSEREFEKITAGLGLNTVAFKKLNPGFWFKGADQISKQHKKHLFLYIKFKKLWLDILTKFHILPAQTLVTVIFKSLPDKNTIEDLKKNGYHVVNIPKNPYIKA